MREKDIQNEIRLAVSEYAIIFRINTGTFKTADGRYVSTGVPVGHPDLYGFRKSDGKLIYIEVKTEKGKLSKEQKHFLEVMSKYPIIAGVARSASEAVNLINGSMETTL